MDPGKTTLLSMLAGFLSADGWRNYALLGESETSGAQASTQPHGGNDRAADFLAVPVLPGQPAVCAGDL